MERTLEDLRIGAHFLGFKTESKRRSTHFPTKVSISVKDCFGTCRTFERYALDNFHAQFLCVPSLDVLVSWLSGAFPRGFDSWSFHSWKLTAIQ